MATIQSPARCACGVPGTRGPKASCWRVYDIAESPTKAVFAREEKRSQAESVETATTAESVSRSVRGSGIGSGLGFTGSAAALRGVAEAVGLQRGRVRKSCLPPVEVVLVRLQPRPWRSSVVSLVVEIDGARSARGAVPRCRIGCGCVLYT